MGDRERSKRTSKRSTFLRETPRRRPANLFTTGRISMKSARLKINEMPDRKRGIFGERGTEKEREREREREGENVNCTRSFVWNSSLGVKCLDPRWNFIV